MKSGLKNRRRMKRTNNTRKQLNNKGFSLVEVIVAIIIVMVASAPVLSCFVDSARYNAKAKVNQYITGAAQSVMEGVKANDIDKLVEQFTDPDPTRFKVVSSPVPGVSAFTAYSMDARDPMATIADPYVFRINGMPFEGNVFDAVITVSPFGTAGDPNYGINEVDYIENMNGFRDAIYTEQTDLLTTAYNSALDDIVADLNAVSGSRRVNALGVIEWYGDFTRDKLFESQYKSKIAVDRVTEVSATGGGSQKVDVTIKINVEVKNLEYKPGLYFSKTYSKTVDSVEIYDNSATVGAGATLENVFLFVYPAYKSSAIKYSINADKYNIVNNLSGSTPLNVFFVKQVNNSYSSGELNTYENLYKPTINCNSYVNLYHNTNDNLAGGTMSGDTNISALSTSHIIDGLTNRENQGLLYSINVDLYNSGDTDIIYSLTGTMSDR